METDGVPTTVTLVEGVHHGETVERVVLQVEFFVGFTGHYKVKGEFPVLLHVEVLVGCLFLEEGYYHTLVSNFISNAEEISC